MQKKLAALKQLKADLATAGSSSEIKKMRELLLAGNGIIFAPIQYMDDLASLLQYARVLKLTSKKKVLPNMPNDRVSQRCLAASCLDSGEASRYPSPLTYPHTFCAVPASTVSSWLRSKAWTPKSSRKYRALAFVACLLGLSSPQQVVLQVR